MGSGGEIIQQFSIPQGWNNEQIDRLLAIMEADQANDIRRLNQEDLRLTQKQKEQELEERKLVLKEK